MTFFEDICETYGYPTKLLQWFPEFRGELERSENSFQIARAFIKLSYPDGFDPDRDDMPESALMYESLLKLGKIDHEHYLYLKDISPYEYYDGAWNGEHSYKEVMNVAIITYSQGTRTA